MTKVWEETWFEPLVSDDRDAYFVAVPGPDGAELAIGVPNTPPMTSLSSKDAAKLWAARAKLVAAAPDLVRALLAVEWHHGECDICGAFERDGHEPDCPVGGALRKAGVR